MENGVEAIRMGFSMFIFALALTTAMYIFSICGNTAQAIVYYTDESNFYDNISLSEDNPNKITTSRYVGFDTVIPTLYRYYKENFCVKIYDKSDINYEEELPNGRLIQVFDITLENKVNAAYSKTNGNPSMGSEEYYLLKTYGKDSLTNLFGAPWNVNSLEYAKKRVDLFINGSVGYINNVKVNYLDSGVRPTNSLTPANLKYYLKNSDLYKIKEEFVKYNYSGDTISVGEGDNIETLTGNKIPDTKIEITYTIEPNLNI